MAAQGVPSRSLPFSQHRQLQHRWETFLSGEPDGRVPTKLPTTFPISERVNTLKRRRRNETSVTNGWRRSESDESLGRKGRGSAAPAAVVVVVVVWRRRPAVRPLPRPPSSTTHPQNIISPLECRPRRHRHKVRSVVTAPRWFFHRRCFF